MENNIKELAENERKMKIILKKSYKSAFGYAYDVLLNVERDSPDFDPYKRLNNVYFTVEKMDNGKWLLFSNTDKTDKVLIEKFGDSCVSFKECKELKKAVEKIIPIWIKY